MCKADSPKVSMKKNGTLVTPTALQKLLTSFTWRSQPLILGTYPAGNMLLSFAILMAGASISKVLLVFKHFAMQTYKGRTFFYHQSEFIFPAILHHWESYRLALISFLRASKNLLWSGDGRFDSMGRSAKYGVYSMMCSA